MARSRTSTLAVLAALASLGALSTLAVSEGGRFSPAGGGDVTSVSPTTIAWPPPEAFSPSTTPPPPVARASRSQHSPRPTDVPLSTLPAVPPPQNGQGDFSWQTSEASWYGPCCWGNHTACHPPVGERYTEASMGVAHKSLPCGTRVVFRHAGVEVETKVFDRGPFVEGREWDLSQALCQALSHCFTGKLEWRLG